MFGYVSANPNLLTEQELQRYRGFYCGLCRSLKTRHGQLSRVSLTFDMTFLALFLSAMYEDAEREERFWCPVHPKERRLGISTRFTDYAADLNVLLAYWNFLDNWKDEKHPAALLGAGVFRNGFRKAQSRYPRQAQTIQRELEELSRLEAEQCSNLDEPSNCFGRLLGELFVVDEQDHFAEELRQFGFFLGKFVYLYDAVMDYEADGKSGSYNPLRLQMPEGLDVEMACQMLTLCISACVEIYERLPMVQDTIIIKNILYSGVWQEFQKKFQQNGTGSTEE